jgi:hypothetical protein
MGLVSSTSSSNYNSLQLSVDKGLTHGLQLQASYTYSHALDDASNFENSGFGGANGRGFNQYPGGKALNYGNSQFDTRNRFVFAPVYVVPFRESGNAFSPINLLLSGWEVSAIATFATGFPFDISYAGGTSLSLWCSASTSFYACPDVPNQVAPIAYGNIRSIANNRVTYFQTSSFATEGLGQFGNISRNRFHGPGIDNTNLILGKNFALSSDGVRSLQIRMESDNVFNHTQFALPTGTFTSGSFGMISSAAAGRQTQLAAKIYF